MTDPKFDIDDAYALREQAAKLAQQAEELHAAADVDAREENREILDAYDDVTVAAGAETAVRERIQFLETSADNLEAEADAGHKLATELEAEGEYEQATAAEQEADADDRKADAMQDKADDLRPELAELEATTAAETAEYEQERAAIDARHDNEVIEVSADAADQKSDLLQSAAMHMDEALGLRAAAESAAGSAADDLWTEVFNLESLVEMELQQANGIEVPQAGIDAAEQASGADPYGADPYGDPYAAEQYG